ncbi:MAG: hypothetical protein A2V64_10715 [Bacteroidetes bacterium RBG_13_43_22]|nr:MAG: hypothetical protein A2V64_10715 [Bacteroidetes bacterium RBG_13_43_22]
MKKLLIIPVLLGFLNSVLLSQEKKPEYFELNGYLTTLQSAMFDTLSGPFIYENLLHNRLNFKGYLNDNITLAVELRNRLFTGDMVRSYYGYSDMVGTDEGWLDMSWNIVDERSFFLNTTIDRVWLDLNFNKFQAKIGRQRINWGQTFVWNPNDIFNAYSFFDFDYTERPGSDAVRLQYYPSFSSAIELAAKIDSEDDVTAAGLYRFSKWGYDIQFLAGYSNSSDVVAGAGWSGSIGSVSFRGEGSWFRPLDNFRDTAGTTIITAGFDKVFEKNSMAQIQLMYCNNPLELTNIYSFYTGNLSARDLAFSEFSAFGQFTWAATPLMNIGISAMWFPDLKGYFAGPSFDYSLAENVDFSILWQHFDAEMNSLKTRINLIFLRIRHSF